MEKFFVIVGIASIALGVLYLLNLYSNIVESSTFVEDQKVYEAARLYAQGRPNDEIKELLSKCLDFDDEEADEIIYRVQKISSLSADKYKMFLKAVNSALGKEIYSTDSQNKLML